MGNQSSKRRSESGSDHVSDGDSSQCRLTIGGSIGRGSYGEVLEGTLGSRQVAVKKIHTELLCSRETESCSLIANAFRRECDILKRAKHPHIVELLEVDDNCIEPGSRSSAPILVMERMHQTLFTYLENNEGALSRDKQVDICCQISSGLLFLHQSIPQILHRDITTKNILVNEDGSVVKLSDFGQSKLLQAPNMYLKTTAPGTIVYMPPECLGDNPRFTDRSDMFSFGVVMLSVSIQKFPQCGWKGIGVTPEVERRAKDLEELDDKHPLKVWILRCFDTEPKNRPDIEEMHSFLLSFPLEEHLSEGGYFEGHMRLRIEEIRNRPLQKEFKSEKLLQSDVQLQTLSLPSLPNPTHSASATLIGSMLYVAGGGCSSKELSLVVQAYSLDTGTWMLLPPSPVYWSASANVRGQLALIGGRDARTDEMSSQICLWDTDKEEWTSTIPPMPTKRFQPGVVQKGTSVIVLLGGVGEDEKSVLDTFDILNTDTLQWTPALFKLPVPMASVKTAICDQFLYILGEKNALYCPSKQVWKLPIIEIDQLLTSQRIQNDTDHLEWIELTTVPFHCCGLLPRSTCPLVVGGRDSSHNSNSAIFVFDVATKSWSSVGRCGTNCVNSSLLPLSASSLIAIGGFANPKNIAGSLLDSVRIHFV